MSASATIEEVREAASLLTNEWARLLAPHFGPTGSMDLDLRDWPRAEGPSHYNQYSHFAFLLLATGEIPGATAEEETAYRKLALANLEYTLAITDAAFHTPHYSRGRDWGRHIGEWLVYYQLCSLELLERRQIGSADLRARLAKVVMGAVTTLHGRFVERFAVTPKEFTGNHDTWHGMLFFRAGQYFHRADWMAYARDFFARCVLPFQSADGYWPEGHGIVVGYSLTTAEAVSLYAEHSGDAAARESMGRFLGFYDYFAFPDGTTATAVDVRMRYYRMPFMFLPPGFLGTPAGRELVLGRLQGARRHFREEGVHDNGAQGFAFFSSFAEYVFKPDLLPPPTRVRAAETLPAARLVQGPWRGYLSWQVVPEIPNRFILDTQNFVELWHRDAGYLAGTGGSKFMPRFSTLRRTNEGRAYIPDRARVVRTTPTLAEAAYEFGGDEILMRVALEDGRAVVAARLAKVAAGRAYEFALLLAFRRGDVLSIDGVTEKIDPSVLIHTGGGQRPARSFTWRNLTWTLPEGTFLEYPLVPHNSYTQDGLPSPDDYVGRINFSLSLTEKAVVIG